MSLDKSRKSLQSGTLVPEVFLSFSQTNRVTKWLFQSFSIVYLVGTAKANEIVYVWTENVLKTRTQKSPFSDKNCR